MTEKDTGGKYVKVKDEAGNNFLCPIDALKDLNNATQEELDNCVDIATRGRYPSNIEVENEK